MFTRKTAGFQIAEYIAARIQPQLAGENYRILTSPVSVLPDRFPDHPKVQPPVFALYREGNEIPLWILEVDPQACGPQKDFTRHIRLYEEARVMELWIFYPKDRILVVRTMREDGSYSKPSIYTEGESVSVESLPIRPFPMDSLLEA